MVLQIIETSETDSTIAIAQVIGELIDAEEAAGTSGAKFVEEAEALYSREQHAQLLDKFIGYLDLVLSKASGDADLECILNIISHLVGRIALPDGSAAAKRFAAALAAKTDSRPDKRLQTLVNLYNLVYDNDSKYAVLLEALSFAKRAGLADALLPAVRAHADEWASDLSLSPAAERALYAAAADMLAGVTRKPKTAAREAYRLLVKLVASYEGAPAAELAAAKPHAAQVVAEFVRSPDLFTFDLADCAAVKALAGDAEHAPLARLLDILLRGSVADFQAFSASNAALFEGLGVTQAEALSKMRLMALMGLAHGASELAFADVQSALALESLADVEGVVVQAIGKRIIEARIDQLRGVVTVARCPPRTFGAEQWRELQGQLAAWSETVKGVSSLAADSRSVLSLPVRA